MPLVPGGHRLARVEYSGFLDHYDQFTQIGPLYPDVECVPAGVKWTKYHKIRILPVEACLIARKDYRTVSDSEVQWFQNYLQLRLSRTLGKQLTLTDQAGPDVMDVRAAITRLKPTIRTVNAASWFIPWSFLYTSSYTAATNSTVAMGEAGMEIEFRDSVTQARLYAMVGMRFGSSLDIEQITRWGIAVKEFDTWVEFLADRIWALRRTT